MSSSREDSPDWLRSFQAPTHSSRTLFLDSDSSPNVSPARVDRVDSYCAQRDKTLTMGPNVDGITTRRKRREGGDAGDRLAAEEVLSEEHAELNVVNHSVWTLSSDSESCPDDSPKRKAEKCRIKMSGEDEDAILVGGNGGSPLKKVSKKKSPIKRPKVEGGTLDKEKKTNDNIQRKGSHGYVAAGEDTSDKHITSPVSTSGLPLVLSEKVHRSKALVECEGESIDLSGDMGAVGRIVIPGPPSGNNEMYLDLKGTIYRTMVVPSRTFCVVSFGQSEAKVEAIMNDFIQLKPQSNVFEAETMVEGTLEGFSFDSEDETDKMPKSISHQTDQSEGIEGQTNGKTKGKAGKSSGMVRKKVKTAGGKLQPAKKARKKTQVSKKAKPKR